MKKEFKYMVSGFLAAAFIFGAGNIYGETARSIDAIFGRVALVVNGTRVPQETLLFDGTTYVPLRAAAEVLGMEVDYNPETATAYLNNAGNSPQPETSQMPQEMPHVLFSDISYDITVQPKNALGVVTMAAVFTNNSEYPLTYIQLSFADSASGGTKSINTGDTLAPGETSDIYNAFGPESGNTASLILAEVQYTYIADNIKYNVIYNCQSNAYSYTPME